MDGGAPPLLYTKQGIPLRNQKGHFLVIFSWEPGAGAPINNIVAPTQFWAPPPLKIKRKTRVREGMEKISYCFEKMKNNINYKTELCLYHLIMLDYSIRGPLASSISPGFYGWTGSGGSSSMVSKPRSWVQFPRPCNFPLCVSHPH
jgi:hypothetical protein